MGDSSSMHHDPHAQPPGDLRVQFRAWQKTAVEALGASAEVLDTAKADGDERVQSFEIDHEDEQRFQTACHEFAGRSISFDVASTGFRLLSLPGLLVYPRLFPADVQILLLDKLLHRDLSDLHHTTNLDIHYENSYRENNARKDQDKPHCHSVFDKHPTQQTQPKDPNLHRPLTMKQILARKLRWVTLGGQYDWTNKVYPDEQPPSFPADISNLLRGFFQHITPEAAILNLYSPGDNLSLHRDVSEECDTGLISVSIGCDALFMVANEDGSQVATIRLHSGDVVLMSDELKDWPHIDTSHPYPHWHGWLAGKRINLNVRQMKP